MEFYSALVGILPLLPLLEQHQKELAKREGLNEIESHNKMHTLPLPVYAFQVQITHYTNNQEDFKGNEMPT